MANVVPYSFAQELLKGTHNFTSNTIKLALYTANPYTTASVERYTQLKGVEYVDEIIPYRTEEDLEDILLMYPINVRIIGEEYKKKTFTGRAICSKRGIEIYYNKRDHRFSSSDLRKRVSDRENKNVKDISLD